MSLLFYVAWSQKVAERTVGKDDLLMTPVLKLQPPTDAGNSTCFLLWIC